MNPRLFILCLCLMLLVQCSRAEVNLQNQRANNGKVAQSNQENDASDSPRQSGSINEDVAISIARTDANKALGSLEDYNVVACEQKDMWLVIFDPKEVKRNENVLEYLISKRGGGWVLWKEKISQETMSSNKEREETLQEPVAASKEAAIAITKKDALAISEKLERYSISACELPRTWFIMYALKEAATGGGKQYLIDKKTGRVLYKKYSQ